jgi:hypothetical protein
MGRGRDTILAHITPREAKKLKREGGRGSNNPETGLLEFDDGIDFTSSFTEFPMSIDYSAAQAPAQLTQIPETAYQAPSQGFYNYQPVEATPFQSYGADSWAGSLPNQFAQAAPLVLGPGGVPSATNFMVRNDASGLAPKIQAQAPSQPVIEPTAAQMYAEREAIDARDAADIERQREENARIARGQEQRDQAAPPPAAAPPAAPVAGAVAGATQAPKLSDAIAAAGLDTTKLSGSDLTRINALQTAVVNGSMTLEQASNAIQQMAKGQTFSGGISSYLSDPGNALKLALGLGIGALGMYNQSNARKQAADVSNQMKGLASQYATMAQPFLQQGGQQYGLATQGALTPASQQQFDTARAQLAQAAARTGSVGAMQATQIAEQLRQSALNSQMTQGLQVLAAGNAQMGQALQTQLGALNTNVTLGNQAAQAASNFFPALGMIFGGVKG